MPIFRVATALCRLEPCPRRGRGRGCAHPGERPAAAGREHPAGGAGRARVRRERPTRARAASREPDRRAHDSRRIRLVRRRAYGGGPVAAVHHRLRRRSPDRRILRAPRPRLPIGKARDQDRAPRGGGHVRLRVRASARVAALRRPARPEMRRVPRERVPRVPKRHARRGPRAPDARLRPRDPGCRRCHPRPALAGRDRAATPRARARVPVRWNNGRDPRGPDRGGAVLQLRRRRLGVAVGPRPLDRSAVLSRGPPAKPAGALGGRGARRGARRRAGSGKAPRRARARPRRPLARARLLAAR